MSDILHQLHIDGPRDAVLRSLTTIEGLASWWTSTTEGESAPGSHIDFRFGEHVTRARVDAIGEDHVGWTIARSNPDWDGTRVTFDLSEDDGKTLVRFGHRGWAESNQFFEHCSMKWAIFLLSLKDRVETGTGRPFPGDIHI